MEDMSKYLDVYLSEAEEHLENLNSSLLKLEDQPNNKELINSLFRSAHTIKGDSAAMGFQKISKLAHSIEDVLGLFKDQKLIANKRVIDLLFKSFDALEFMIKEVGKGKKESFDIDPLIEKLKLIETFSESKGKTSAESPSVCSLTNEDHMEGAEGVELAYNPHLLKTVKFIKVNIELLDKLMNLVGELLIVKMMLEQIRTENHLEILNEPLDRLNHLLSEAQFEVMQARLIEICQVFNRFPRMIRDISKKENKKVNFIIEGGNIKLDRSVIDKLAEPLIHILRNAIDHGIEPPEERKKRGKKEVGTLKLKARKERNTAVIEIEDDGNGFDVAKIKAVAVKKGIISREEAEKLTHKQILMLPFRPNFSTAEKVTDVSGRGVGLDVVKNMIESLNGSVRVESETGKGTKFVLELPLTLAIIQCFLVRVGDQTYGIPLSNVVRVLNIERKRLKQIGDYETFILDEEDIPLLRLSKLLGIIAKEDKNRIKIVLVEKERDQLGLVVDKIIGKRELKIKPLDKTLKRTRYFSGTTILGDGSIALIIDVNSLL